MVVLVRRVLRLLGLRVGRFRARLKRGAAGEELLGIGGSLGRALLGAAELSGGCGVLAVTEAAAAAFLTLCLWGKRARRLWRWLAFLCLGGSSTSLGSDRLFWNVSGEKGGAWFQEGSVFQSGFSDGEKGTQLMVNGLAGEAGGTMRLIGRSAHLDGGDSSIHHHHHHHRAAENPP